MVAFFEPARCVLLALLSAKALLEIVAEVRSVDPSATAIAVHGDQFFKKHGEVLVALSLVVDFRCPGHCGLWIDVDNRAAEGGEDFVAFFDAFEVAVYPICSCSSVLFAPISINGFGVDEFVFVSGNIHAGGERSHRILKASFIPGLLQADRNHAVSVLFLLPTYTGSGGGSLIHWPFSSSRPLIFGCKNEMRKSNANEKSGKARYDEGGFAQEGEASEVWLEFE